MHYQTITPALCRRLESQSFIPVLVKMNNPDVFDEAAAVALGEVKTRSKRATKLKKLQRAVASCQKECCRWLTATSDREATRLAAAGLYPRRSRGGEPLTLWINNSIAVDATLEMICELAERDDVAWVREINLEDPIVDPVAEAIPQGLFTWGLTRLRIPQVWARGFRGQGVRVAHLDTGVDGAHPDLAGRLERFAVVDFIVRLFEIPPDLAFDSGDHGTHTAGTIVGGDASGVAIGVAPEASLLSALVIEGGQALDRVLRGMQWAAEQAVDVLSMSLGFRPGLAFEDDFEDAVNNLVFLDIFPAIASGNEGPGTSRAPGLNVQSWSVGATDRLDRAADFSSGRVVLRQRDRIQPDVTAPGVQVMSTLPGGGYGFKNGTSMATPHVAGIVALLRQANPGATVPELKQVIAETALDLGRFGDDIRFGFGLIRPLDALDALLS